MPPRKRARAAEQPATPAPEEAVVLAGGYRQMPSLVQLWREGALCDASVTASEGGATETFSAHRNVLAASSEYFRALYVRSTSPDRSGPLTLDGISPAAMSQLLAFVYEGQCSLPSNALLVPVLEAACRLQLAPLRDAAVQAIVERLTPESCLGAWTLGAAHEIPALALAARKETLACFADVTSDALATLSHGQLSSLLSDDALAAPEPAVFRAVEAWCGAQQPDEAAVAALLSHVRFGLFEFEELQSVRAVPLMQSPAAMNVLTTALAEAFHRRDTPRTRRRVGGGALYILGGTGADGITRLSGVQIFDPQTNSWAAGPAMGTARYICAAAVLDGKIFVMGGVAADGSTRLSSVELFDPQTDSWAARPAMGTARSSHAAVVLSGKLYVMGGVATDSRTRLSSFELFDPQTNSWAAGPPMGTVRSSHAAAAVEGKVYVMGGVAADGRTRLSSVELFDPQTNSWTAGPPMGTARSHTAAAVVGGKIYVVGGMAAAETRLSSVDIFDSQTGSWTAGPDMGTARSAATVTVVDGKIYVVGGFDGDARLSSVQVLDPQTGSWAAGPPMPTRRTSHVAAALGVR